MILDCGVLAGQTPLIYGSRGVGRVTHWSDHRSVMGFHGASVWAKEQIPASARSVTSDTAPRSSTIVPSSSLPDCLGRVRRVKAKPHAVASRALTQRPRPEGRQLSRRTGEDQARPSAQAGPRFAGPLAGH